MDTKMRPRGVRHFTFGQFMLYFVLTLFALACLLPMVLVVIASLSTEASILEKGFSFFPTEWTLDGYRYISTFGDQIIHRNAESWNCDENHIAIMGFSAGGHLATHYSSNFDCAEVRSVFPESYPVAASILCYPVITADPAYTHLESIENVSGHKPITQEDVKRFSCELLVTEQTPPAYIWHTAEDQSVPVYNSFLYARALSEKHIPFEFHVFPFGAHGLATCDEQTNDGEITARIAHNQRWIEESQQWLKLLWANH